MSEKGLTSIQLYNKQSNEISDYLMDNLLKKSNNLSPTKNPFIKQSLMENIQNFTLLYLLIKSSNSLFSHKDINDIDFSLERNYSGNSMLRAYVSVACKPEKFKHGGFFNVGVWGGDWDETHFPENISLNKDNNPELYDKFYTFCYAMEMFSQNNLNAAKNFFYNNEGFSYKKAMLSLKSEYEEMFSILESKYLKENINTNKKAKSSKPKLL